jgi:hypothetical protein
MRGADVFDNPHGPRYREDLSANERAVFGITD